MRVKISKPGRIVIPAELRRKYELAPGAIVDVVDYGGALAIVARLAHPVEEVAGLFAGRVSLTQALLAERRREPRRGG